MNSNGLLNNEEDKMEVDRKKLEEEEDEVVAEMDCYHVPLNRQHYSAATLHFLTEKPAKMEDCTARMKPLVKHLEIDYENGSDRSDGIVNNDELLATFAGKGTSETEVLNHAICFIEQGKAYFVEVDDTFKMRRKINASIVTDASEEPSSSTATKRNTSPVRVKFARAETDAQRKRREQSSYFKHQQAEQEAWKPVTVIHKEPKFALSIVENGDELLPNNSTGRIKSEPK
uniref:Uncharacterized protein n=1 Tax=Panagrolaimus sp. PS1159 TaxID=55785 RepID=A0AC35FPL4_9BILA